MKICFTSMCKKYAFSICDLDTEEIIHIPNEIKVADHRPFGISWRNDRLYIAQPTSVISYDKSFKNPKVYLDNLWYGIHQILFYDDWLWMVSPRLNAVERHNLITERSNFLMEEIKELPKEFVGQDKLKFSMDINHFNSIFIKEDRLYITAHNHSSPSFITSYKYPEMKMIKRYENMGRQSHNVFVDGDEIFTLDSLDQSVISTKGTHIRIGNSGQFIRGLGATKEMFVAGCFPWNPRERRLVGNSFIVLIDRKQKKVIKRICVKNVGNINDIRILDEPDLAHGIKQFLYI